MIWSISYSRNLTEPRRKTFSSNPSATIRSTVRVDMDRRCAAIFLVMRRWLDLFAVFDSYIELGNIRFKVWGTREIILCASNIWIGIEWLNTFLHGADITAVEAVCPGAISSLMWLAEAVEGVAVIAEEDILWSAIGASRVGTWCGNTSTDNVGAVTNDVFVFRCRKGAECFPFGRVLFAEHQSEWPSV